MSHRSHLTRWHLPFPWWAILVATAVGGFVLYLLAEVATSNALRGLP
jgi:hypothetical protein